MYLPSIIFKTGCRQRNIIYMESNSLSEAIFLPRVISVCGPGNILNSPETGLIRSKGPKRCEGS